MISQSIINIFVTEEPSKTNYITEEIYAGDEDNEAPKNLLNLT